MGMCGCEDIYYICLCDISGEQLAVFLLFSIQRTFNKIHGSGNKTMCHSIVSHAILDCEIENRLFFFFVLIARCTLFHHAYRSYVSVGNAEPQAFEEVYVDRKRREKYRK